MSMHMLLISLGDESIQVLSVLLIFKQKKIREFNFWLLFKGKMFPQFSKLTQEM